MATIGKNVSISQLQLSSCGSKYSHRHNRTPTGSRYEPKTPPVMVEYRGHKKPLRKPLRASEQKRIEKPPLQRAVFVFSGALRGRWGGFAAPGHVGIRKAPRDPVGLRMLSHEKVQEQINDSTEHKQNSSENDCKESSGHCLHLLSKWGRGSVRHCVPHIHASRPESVTPCQHHSARVFLGIVYIG